MEIISYPEGDEEFMETYSSFGEVEKDLESTAVDEYRTQVMGKLRAGATYFTVNNGPDVDVWEVYG